MNTDICTFAIISRGIILRMRTVPDKVSTENEKKKTRFMFKFFFPEIRIFYIVHPDSHR